MSAFDTRGYEMESGLTGEIRTSVRRFRALWDRRWQTFALTFVVAVVAVQAVAFIWPGTYEAHAAVLLQKTRFPSDIDPDPRQATVVSDTVSAGEVNSEIALLTSRQVLEATIKATGLEKMRSPWYVRVAGAPMRAYDEAYSWVHGKPNPTPQQRALAGLEASVSVDRLKDSNILVVTYRAGDPRFAEIVLNELLKDYLVWHVSVHSGNDVQPFFTKQADLLNTEIGGLQAQLQDLKASAGVADFSAEREIAMRQDAELTEEKLRLERQIGELDGRGTSLKKALKDDPGWTQMSTTTKSTGDAVDNMQAEVLRLELEQIRLESRYTDSSPFVTENKTKLEAARRAVNLARSMKGEESTVGMSPVQTGLRQDIDRAAADRSGAAKRLALVTEQQRAARARLEALDQQAVEAERLDLQLRSAKDRYVMYLDRTEKARVDAALNDSRVANVTVVQYADAPLKPVNPKRLVTLILSLVGGFAIALLLCAWLEVLNMGMAAALEAVLPRPESAV